MSLDQWRNIFLEKTREHFQDQWSLTFDDNIEEIQQGSGGWYQYIRGSFARFTCSLCKRSWPSKKVLVIFHFTLFHERSEGKVKVRRYRQKCRRCLQAQMEEPLFTGENIKVLVDKIIEKIRMRCYNENIGKQNRFSQFHGRVNGPHERAHCEACLKGICRDGK
ncbi:receptor-transporting protein 3-like [Chanos chanos]|uniref:Receptor-transporting protein 3-like n=1 Tax=Chanos chanos TaxID=29144 RepID=A0A6J2WS04_CHACN|nr:receptor-transporting protein 3-like [Chanos chanos]